VTPQEFLYEFDAFCISATEWRQRVALGVSLGIAPPPSHSPAGATDGSHAAICVAHSGLSDIRHSQPRANARGYVLSPLRGWGRLVTAHRMIGGAE